MTTHIYHEDTHTHGLCNECERCQEHAEHPLASLDRDNLARIRRGDLFTALDRKAAAELGELNQAALAEADAEFNA